MSNIIDFKKKFINEATISIWADKDMLSTPTPITISFNFGRDDKVVGLDLKNTELLIKNLQSSVDEYYRQVSDQMNQDIIH